MPGEWLVALLMSTMDVARLSARMTHMRAQSAGRLRERRNVEVRCISTMWHYDKGAQVAVLLNMQGEGGAAQMIRAGARLRSTQLVPHRMPRRRTE